MKMIRRLFNKALYRMEKGIASSLYPNLAKNFLESSNEGFDLENAVDKTFHKFQRAYGQPEQKVIDEYLDMIKTYQKEDFSHTDAQDMLTPLAENVSVENFSNALGIVDSYKSNDIATILVGQGELLTRFRHKTKSDIGFIDMLHAVNDKLMTGNKLYDTLRNELYQEAPGVLGVYPKAEQIKSENYQPSLMGRVLPFAVVAALMGFVLSGTKTYEQPITNTYDTLKLEYTTIPAPQPYDITGVFTDSEYIVLDLIHDAADSLGVEPRYAHFLTVAYIESKMDAKAISFSGAKGLMQLEKKTGKDFGLNDSTIWDPFNNVKAGMNVWYDYSRFFRGKRLPNGKRINKYETKHWTQMGYNIGPGIVLDHIVRYGISNPHEYRMFVKQSLNKNQQLIWAAPAYDKRGKRFKDPQTGRWARVDEPVDMGRMSRMIPYMNKYDRWLPYFIDKMEDFHSIGEGMQIWGRTKPIEVIDFSNMSTKAKSDGTISYTPMKPDSTSIDSSYAFADSIMNDL